MAALTTPIGIPGKEAKTKIEIHLHPVILEAEIIKYKYNLELSKPFSAFYSSIYFTLFLQQKNFLFHLYFLV